MNKEEENDLTKKIITRCIKHIKIAIDRYENLLKDDLHKEIPQEDFFNMFLDDILTSLPSSIYLKKQRFKYIQSILDKLWGD